MRKTFLVAVFLIAWPLSANAATRIADPAEFVRDVYRHMQTSRDYQPPQDIYSPHLANLFDLERKEAGQDVGTLDFDFWSGAQDYKIEDVKVSETPGAGRTDRQIVTAHFKNIGKPKEAHFYFEKTAQGWKLDDMRMAGRDEPYTLSLILKYGWDGEQR